LKIRWPSRYAHARMPYEKLKAPEADGFARQMPGAKEVKCSEFATAIINN